MTGNGHRLRVVLCWHMHQPEYRDPASGQWLASWTLLHALKDYTDMAAHLEARPGACAVVNFSPVLLDQLEGLGAQLAQWAANGAATGEPLFDALVEAPGARTPAGRRGLVDACLAARRPRILARFPEYRQRVEARAGGRNGDNAGEDDADLAAWQLLAWLGESVRGSDAGVVDLLARTGGFNRQDRHRLATLVAETVQALPGRYRELSAQGRVELSTSPWTHPILPLLLDLRCAWDATPGRPQPLASTYPGGARRAEQQLVAARELHRRRFGLWPAGCWLPEAAVSDDALARVGASGFAWTVASAATLRRSFGDSFVSGDRLLHPGHRDGANPVVFFRDDGLSDRIGFEYQRWAPVDAVADLVQRLEDIAARRDGQGGVVTLALDGENAWEHYPDNGWAFLSGLYAALDGHASLELTTFSRCLADPGTAVSTFGRLLAGSWAGGDLSHWIGSEAANRAWNRLVQAKLLFDRHGGHDDADAVRQLAVCEGSDWFWWADGDAEADASARFHRLYDIHLAGLYRALGCEPPDQPREPH